MNISRRKALKLIGLSGVMASAPPLFAQSLSATASKKAAALDGKTLHLPQREIPVHHKTQVLVIGAGCAGFCAAVGAAKAGAKTTLIERYGQLGGLFTAGIVPLIIGTRINGGKTVCLRGVAGEMMDRLKNMDGGIVGYEASHPTVDTEATKWLMQVMLEEAKVRLLYHSWCTDVIMDGNVIKGAIFESKQGAFAVLADAVVDTSGDGDVFAFAGASHESTRGDTGLPFRIKNLNSSPEFKSNPGKGREAINNAIRPDKKVYRTKVSPDVGWAITARTPLPDVDWINHGSIRINPLQVDGLTKAECKLRKNAWDITNFIRKLPSHEKARLIEVAPMLGPRTVRILDGVHKMSAADLHNKEPRPDAIGISPGNASGIPYGILLPKDVNNLIVGGRCVSAEPSTIGELRLVPYCCLTGHAAGVGAALAVKGGTTPSKVGVEDVRDVLKTQGAFLG